MSTRRRISFYRRATLAPGRDGGIKAIMSGRTVETPVIETIPILIGQEDDGRWWADIESMPGVMAYGETREAAIAAVRTLALRVVADCIEHGEEVPPPFAKLFSIA